MTIARSISAQDSHKFAALSGDRNPAHTDPVAAGRLPFGRLIVHGAHTLCLSLDACCKQLNKPITLTSLAAEFRRPVFYGDPIDVAVSAQDGSIKIRAMVDGQLVLKLRCNYSNHASSSGTAKSTLPPAEVAVTLDRAHLLDTAGTLPVMADRALTTELFPELVAVISIDTVALILTTSRAVGMKCPGTHSLFTAVNLQFDPAHIVADTLHYRASSIDTRFNILEIELSAPGVTGSAQCQLLAPVHQIGSEPH